MLFLTNLSLRVVNFQQADVFADEVEALKARSLFSVEELDDFAFLSLHELKDPNYSQPIEDFLVKYAFVRKRDSEAASPSLTQLQRSDQLLSRFNKPRKSLVRSSLVSELLRRPKPSIQKLRG